jgi:hypothetical protein
MNNLFTQSFDSLSCTNYTPFVYTFQEKTSEIVIPIHIVQCWKIHAGPLKNEQSNNAKKQ